MMTADELRGRRLALGLSRDQLARAAAVSRWTLRALELGTRRGGAGTWRRLEAALALGALDHATAAERIYAELADGSAEDGS
jgi:DNA-binding XRE family transcriptional regulator